MEFGMWNVELVALRAMLNYSIMNYNKLGVIALQAMLMNLRSLTEGKEFL